MWFGHIRDNRSCKLLSVNGACPSLVTCAVPTSVNTTPELSRPAFGVLPKTGDEELEDRGKRGWERLRMICARSTLAWRRQDGALWIDRHGVYSWMRLRPRDTLQRERERERERERDITAIWVVVTDSHSFMLLSWPALLLLWHCFYIVARKQCSEETHPLISFQNLSANQHRFTPGCHLYFVSNARFARRLAPSIYVLSCNVGFFRVESRLCRKPRSAT